MHKYEYCFARSSPNIVSFLRHLASLAVIKAIPVCKLMHISAKKNTICGTWFIKMK